MNVNIKIVYRVSSQLIQFVTITDQKPEPVRGLFCFLYLALFVMLCCNSGLFVRFL